MHSPSLVLLIVVALSFATFAVEGKACASNSDCGRKECCQGVGAVAIDNGNVPSNGNVGYTAGECMPRGSIGDGCITEYGSSKMFGETSPIYDKCPCLSSYCIANMPKGSRGTPGLCSFL